MSPGGDWKLTTRDSNHFPPTESISTHGSLEEALTTACSFASVPHQAALRIEGPGVLYDQERIRDECSRRRQQQT
jgi:hypothetical protein